MRGGLFVTLSKPEEIMKVEDFHRESQHHRLHLKYAKLTIAGERKRRTQLSVLEKSGIGDLILSTH